MEPEERTALVAEWRRLAAEPKPVSPRPYGCATFLVAAAFLLLLPKLADLTGFTLPEPLRLGLLFVLGIALVGGFVVGVFFGSGVYGRAAVRAREALDWLAADAGTGEAEARMRNAVALLHYAVVWEGPTVAQTVDPAAARTRLQLNLDYVLQVEQVLIEELNLAPLFVAKRGE